MNDVVAILTDFGSGSNYVGVMKGVLLRTFPDCKIVDLFNDVKPQSIREGAWILSTSCDYFPRSVKTIHTLSSAPIYYHIKNKLFVYHITKLIRKMFSITLASFVRQHFCALLTRAWVRPEALLR